MFLSFKNNLVFKFFLFVILSTFTFSSNLSLGSFDNLPPFSFKQNKELQGIDVDISTEIFKKAQTPISIKEYPWKRLKSNIVNESMDGIIALYLTKDSMLYPFVFLSEVLYHSKLKVYSLKESHIKINKIAEFKNLKVGLIEGYEIGVEEFDNSKEIIKHKVRSEKQLILMLKAKRVDVIVMEELPFLYYMKEDTLKSDIQDIYTLNNWPIKIALSKNKVDTKSKELIKKINKIIKKMKKDGTIKNIMKRYK